MVYGLPLWENFSVMMLWYAWSLASKAVLNFLGKTHFVVLYPAVNVVV